MNTIEEVLAFNKTFVEEKRYEQFETDKYPEKKLAVLSCMDTRLTELLPAALGLKNGDAKIIKNAGGVIAHPFGSVIRSCSSRSSSWAWRTSWWLAIAIAEHSI